MALLLVVEVGFRARKVWHSIDAERQSLFQSARNGLNILLSFLLGFSLPMALAHYEQQRQLVVDEANVITTVHQRAQLLPEPFRDRILGSLRAYLDARVDFSKQRDRPAITRIRRPGQKSTARNVAGIGAFGSGEPEPGDRSIRAGARRIVRFDRIKAGM